MCGRGGPVDAQRAQGTPVWFLIASDEGHGFERKKNIDFEFDATALFIKTYLLGDERVASPKRNP